MAKEKKDRNRNPKGVRGPSGPPSQGGSPAPGRSAPQGGLPGSSSNRAALERISLPLLTRLHAMPRWIIVVLPAALLLGGLLLRDSWAWLGGILLLLVWAFLAWLTALSWPALAPGSRFFRALIVVAFGAIVVLKFMGKF